MSVVYAPDVSTFQAPVDNSFDREWLIFRVCFNGSIDTHAQHNLAWCVQARTAGKIKGFTGYVVPLPGGNAAVLASLDELGFPHDAPVMIDAEKWNGQPYQINGDHSAQFNDLADALRERQGGRDDLVWAYGNRGPDLEVWPHKAPWLGWVVASYTSADTLTDPPANLIGWQYTDGEPAYDNPHRPHSSAPFGRCDHNALYKLPDEGEDMPLTDADVQKIVDKVKQATIGDETVASALRETHDMVAALQKQVAALQALVASKVGGVNGTLHLAGDVTVSQK